ncbi:MAG: AIR synthase family protein [Desulfurellaceae bacterium]|nr:AIR synthase family protein [Desulfurellaceae bacterium]
MLLPGKLPAHFLKTCIQNAGTEDPRVLIGPRFGEDCAVLDVGEQYLVVKTDPVTFTTEDVGWYAVHINANDVATMGAQPAWFQACLLFPPDTSEHNVRQVFVQIHSTCRDLGISVTGGHTEVTAAVSQPVVVGNMTGVVAKDRLVTTQGVRVGDLVVMTKTAGLEGTGIVFTEKHKELEDILGPELQDEAQNIRVTWGISIVKEALLAAQHGATAMHDPTEGGVAMGLYELTVVSGLGMQIDLDTIPILPSTRVICEHFNINPLGLISSGTLLLTIAADKWPYLERIFQSENIPAQVIGAVTPEAGIRARRNGQEMRFVYSERDELLKVL